MGEPRPVDFVESCASVTAEEKAKILSTNARTMLGLERSPAG
jgi:predicted TIM-barrel fold metal-dependent hydrolase